MEILASLGLGLSVGFLLELIYKSWEHKQLRWPEFWNVQMYGLTAVLFYLVYLLNVHAVVEVILISLIPTTIEYITGSTYWKLKRRRLWDYRGEPHNFKGLLRLRFSLYWAMIGLVYFYIFLPKLF